MNCTLVKTIKSGKDTYNVICIENDNVYDYYLQKVGLIKYVDLPEFMIVNDIEIATKEKFWRD